MKTSFSPFYLKLALRADYFNCRRISWYYRKEVLSAAFFAFFFALFFCRLQFF